MSIRVCVECGKQHNTGIEDRINKTFEPIEKCIDCLMSKCSFNFKNKQIRVDDVENMSYEEMQQKLGETETELLNEMRDYP